MTVLLFALAFVLLIAAAIHVAHYVQCVRLHLSTPPVPVTRTGVTYGVTYGVSGLPQI